MGRKSRQATPALGSFADRPAAETGVNREPQNIFAIYFDRSSSQKDSWDEAQAGVRRVIGHGGSHPAARSTTRVSVALCGPEVTASPYAPFASAALPDTPLAAGSPGSLWIRHLVDGMRAEDARLKASGAAVNKAFAMVVGDFWFDDPEGFDEAVESYRTLENEWRNFTGLLVMTGPNPNRDLAARIGKRHAPVRLDDAKVRELFDWVMVSIIRASVCRPGAPAELPIPTWTLTDGERR